MDINNEPKSIGICTRSIFKNKNLSRGRFKCKNNQSVVVKKNKKIQENKKTRKNRLTK